MDHVTLDVDGVIKEGSTEAGRGPLRHLCRSVSLQDGFLLRSYFKMLERYPELGELNDFFPDFLNIYRTTPGTGDPPPGIDHLELGKTVELIGFPGKPRLETYTSFYGVSGGKAVEIKAWRLERLLDLPVKLGRLKHIVFGDQVDILEFETVFNLFELIDGIAWQLGFHGAPLQCEIRR